MAKIKLGCTLLKDGKRVNPLTEEELEQNRILIHNMAVRSLVAMYENRERRRLAALATPPLPTLPEGIFS